MEYVAFTLVCLAKPF